MEPHHGLNILDYSVLGIILLSGLLALMRGFVREVLSLTAWAGAYFIAANAYPLLEPWTHHHIKNTTGSIALAAVIVFVVALTILTLISYMIAKLIRGRALTAIDRSLGFLFGLMRGALIVCLLYLGATYIPWLNMDKLDKASGSPQMQVEADNPQKPDDKDKSEKAKAKDKPPEWLVESETRPAMADGADMLKGLIPEKDIEKTMKEYDDKAAAAHHAIDDNVEKEIEQKTQDMIGLPGRPLEPKDDSVPSNDDKNHLNLDNLINPKSNP